MVAADPYRYFRIEARELLDQLVQGVLALERSTVAADTGARLLRLAHTLKGAARVVRQAEIADLTHGVEDLLAPLREAGAVLPRTQIDRALATLDRIGSLLERLPTAAAAPAAATAAVPEALPRLQRADVVEVDALLEGLGEIGSELEAVRQAAQEIEDCARAALRAPPAHTRARLQQLERILSGGAERMGRELRQAREAAERLRLVPVTSLFGALERSARDAAHSLGKDVRLEAHGSALRIDGAVLEALLGALIQLVRNAVVHGIETPAERATANKPVTATIRITAARNGSRARFSCHDDGRGVDLDAVRAALAKRGVPAAELARQDADQLLAQLLRGGISTRGAVSELAGRGVGLDVVRATLDKLGGTVQAATSADGTRIDLEVPLTLAALDVLMVEADGQRLALPLDAVRASLRADQGQLVQAADGPALEHAGALLPFLPLTLGIRAGSAPAFSAVVLDGGAAGMAAVGVERLAGIDTVVLQALPALAATDATVLGLFLDAAGEPGMVLDPQHLVPALTQRRSARADQAPDPLPILIVDDSLTTRMLESSILESAGYTVGMAASAEQGLEMVRRERYGLCLVDVEMPGMDGFGFVDAVCSDPALRHIPCILVTSRDAPEDRARAAAVGARAHIVKGEFDQADFLRRVRELVLT